MAGLEDDRHTGIGTPAAHGRCSFPSPACVVWDKEHDMWGTFYTSREVGKLTRYLHVVHFNMIRYIEKQKQRTVSHLCLDWGKQ